MRRRPTRRKNTNQGRKLFCKATGQPLLRRALHALLLAAALLAVPAGPDGGLTAAHASSVSDAKAMNERAGILYQQGRYGEAEKLFREALSIVEKELGKEDRRYAITLNNLATLLVKTGRYEEAEPLYREALAIIEKALGRAHSACAQSLSYLAALYYQMQRFDEADQLTTEAVQIIEAALGPDHPATQSMRKHLTLIRRACAPSGQ